MLDTSNIIPRILGGTVLASTLVLAACGSNTPSYFNTVGVDAPTVEDTCGASVYAYLEGQPMGILDGTNFLPAPRIIEPDMFYRPNSPEDNDQPTRLNIMIGNSGDIYSVFCG